MSRLSVRAVLAVRASGVLVGVACAVGMVLLAGLLVTRSALAAPLGQVAAAPRASISYLWSTHTGGLFSGPHATAYVQVFDRADSPVERTAVTGLPATAFSAAEDGASVSVTAKPVAPDEPIALIVVADTNTGRGWLGTGAKYPDPIQYLRDTALRVVREFPQAGRFALYTMAADASATPALGDRAAAETAAQQLQPNADALLLVQLDKAVAALASAPPAMRRVIVVLSDGNSQSGRPYEVIQDAAAKAHVAVFAVGTVDPNNPFRFLDRMGQETGGQAWYFDKTALQPQPTSPIMLDLLADQAIRAIKSAYRLEYTPPNSGREQRQLVVTVKGPGGAELKSPVSTYRGDPAGGTSTSVVVVAVLLPLLLIAGAGLFYFLRLRPAKSDYYLTGHGPSAGHVPEHYLYTQWRPVGRGGRGYQLDPEDPHFAGLSKTHVYVRVHNLRRVKGPTGHAQTVGTVEAKAGRPSSGVGLNTTFVYNELTGVRPLSERPFQLQTGDLLILQPASRQGQNLNGLPPGVYLRLGNVGGTATESNAPPAADYDADRTVVESVADSDRTMVEPVPGGRQAAGPGPRIGLQPPAPPADADKTQVGQAVRVGPAAPNGGAAAPGRRQP